MMHRTALRLALALAATMVAGRALATAPEIISYQGLLTDDEGVVVENGSYDLRFRIYDTPQTGTGTVLFEQLLQVTVVDGLYNVLLSANALPSGAPLSQVFATGMTYMEVAIEDGPGISVPITLAPRQQIASVPYALQVTSAPSGIPSGAIIMWSGSPAAIPEGWALCDGNGSTPDLRGRFIVGYDPSDTDYDLVTESGGSKTQTLVEANIPQHDHGGGVHSHGLENVSGGNAGPGTFLQTAGAAFQGGTGPTNNSAAIIANYGAATPTPIDRRPPYFVLAFIMKL